MKDPTKKKPEVCEAGIMPPPPPPGPGILQRSPSTEQLRSPQDLGRL